jgi:hypothetical protein
MKALLTLLTCALVLVSCDQRSKSDHSSAAIVKLKVPHGASLSDYSSKVKLAPEIPAYVGQLVAMEKNAQDGQITTCSASLVGKNNIVLTNEHCIPKDLLGSSESCTDRIHIIFSKDQKSMVSSCKKILSYALKNSGKDYAVIELTEPVNIEPAGFSTQGLEDQSLATVYAVNLFLSDDRTHYVSRPRISKCLSVLNSYTDYTHPLSKTITLFGRSEQTGCDIIPGNSGSPLVSDKTNKVVGVIHSHMDKNSNNNSPEFRLIIANTNRMAQASNLAQIPYFNPDHHQQSAMINGTEQARGNRLFRQSFFRDILRSEPRFQKSFELFYMNQVGAHFFTNQQVSHIEFHPGCIRHSALHEDPENLPRELSIFSAKLTDYQHRINPYLQSELFANYVEIKESIAELEIDQAGNIGYVYPSLDEDNVYYRIDRCPDEAF